MARLKSKESEYIAQGKVIFANVTPGMVGAAGLTTNSWNAISNTFNGFLNTVDAADTAKAAAKAATGAKNEAEKESRQQLQNAIDKFYATPAITNEQLENAGLPPRNSGGGSSAPVPVTNLSASPLASGTCTLRWRRNGNSDRTLFEVQVLDGGVWDVLNSTLKTTFKDTDAVPGVPRTYRVISVNQRGRSNPSQEVSIYAGSDSVSLKLAA